MALKQIIFCIMICFNSIRAYLKRRPPQPVAGSRTNGELARAHSNPEPCVIVTKPADKDLIVLSFRTPFEFLG